MMKGFSFNIFQVFNKLERRNIAHFYKSFKKREFDSFEKLRNHQFKLLKILVNHAYHTVPYYRERFNKIGLKPQDLMRPTDISKLPVLTRADIKNNFQKLISSKFRYKDLIEYATGGSTGEPVKFLLTKDQRDMRAAVSFKSYQMLGWDFLDKTLLLAGAPIDISHHAEIKSKIKSYFLRQKIIPAINLKEKDLIYLYQVVKQKKPKVVFGFVSALELFAKYLASHNIYVEIPIIIQMAELVLPEQISLIEERLRGTFYKHYGARDAIAMGMQCTERRGLHANMDTLWIEILKYKQEAYDTDGEIVITDLYSYGMPLIRYQIGDVGRWINSRCSCGRHTSLFDITQGRKANIITTPGGGFVSGLFIPHLFKEIAPKIKQYQVHQVDLDSVIIRIVKYESYTSNDEKFLRRKLNEKFESQINIKFEYSDSIPPENSGKFLFVKSNVPVDFGNT